MARDPMTLSCGRCKGPVFPVEAEACLHCPRQLCQTCLEYWAVCGDCPPAWPGEARLGQAGLGEAPHGKASGD